MARFRARAMFCFDSQQYVIGIADEEAKFMTVSSADRWASLSATTIEYEKRSLVSCKHSSCSRRARRSGLRYVQTQTVIWAFIRSVGTIVLQFRIRPQSDS